MTSNGKNKSLLRPQSFDKKEVFMRYVQKSIKMIFAGETEKFAPKSVDNVDKLVYKCFLPKKRWGFEWTTFNISGVEHGGLCG